MSDGPALIVSPGELDALRGLPHAAQLLYLLCLRRYADAQGVAGRARRLSERQMREALEVPPLRGRQASAVVTPTRRAIRSAVDALVAAGLVVPVKSGAEVFVFRLPQALQGKSVRRMKGPMKGQPLRGASACFDKGKVMNERPMKGPMKGPPQYKSSTNTTEAACEVTSYARAHEEENLPQGVDPQMWALMRAHFRAARSWSLAREVLVLGHLRELVAAGVDANAVIEWAVLRNLCDLRDAHRRMQQDAARRGDALPGESLANRGARQIREQYREGRSGEVVPLRVIEGGSHD